VLVGPLTFLALSKAADGAEAPISRLDDVLPLYRDLLGQLTAAGAAWVQIDEPVLVTDMLDDAGRLAERAYRFLADSVDRPAILVATYFGAAGEALGA